LRIHASRNVRAAVATARTAPIDRRVHTRRPRVHGR
jgi:hypothetical protein